MFSIMPRRVETASGTNAASNSPETYGYGSTEEVGVSKRVLQREFYHQRRYNSN